MNCHDVKERLTEGRTTAAVRRHVEKCADCASFARELAEGGREIAEAFLAVAPSAGFEGRVAARMAEREISVSPRRELRLVRLLAPAGFLLLAGAALLLRPWRGGEAPDRPAAPPPVAVAATITPPNLTFPLEVNVRRGESGAPTVLVLDFAHEERVVALGPRLEDELLESWARGARKARLRVGAEIPTREVILLVELMERLGFSWEISRPKEAPGE